MNNYKIIGLLATMILTYIVLVSFYLRKISTNVRRKFTSSKDIFLTFDDGPNPSYTLEILDLLKKYDIKATFFVIAQKADEHKEIIHRIIEDGHVLGLHSNKHRNPWLKTFWQTKKDFQKSMEIFKELNYPVKYYRAPWGLFNPFTYYYSHKYGLGSVLWSIITNDWMPDTNLDKIVNKVLDNVQNGDIIVLHDSNHKMNVDNGAPKNTIQALNIILPVLIERGFNFGTIDEGFKFEGIGKEKLINHIDEEKYLSGVDI